jgi:hypothetical protein
VVSRLLSPHLGLLHRQRSPRAAQLCEFLAEDAALHRVPRLGHHDAATVAALGPQELPQLPGRDLQADAPLGTGTEENGEEEENGQQLT